MATRGDQLRFEGGPTVRRTEVGVAGGRPHLRSSPSRGPRRRRRSGSASTASSATCSRRFVWSAATAFGWSRYANSSAGWMRTRRGRSIGDEDLRGLWRVAEGRRPQAIYCSTVPAVGGIERAARRLDADRPPCPVCGESMLGRRAGAICSLICRATAWTAAHRSLSEGDRTEAADRRVQERNPARAKEAAHG